MMIYLKMGENSDFIMHVLIAILGGLVYEDIVWPNEFSVLAIFCSVKLFHVIVRVSYFYNYL